MEAALTDVAGLACEDIPLESFPVNGEVIVARFMRFKALNSFAGYTGIGLQFITLDFENV